MCHMRLLRVQESEGNLSYLSPDTRDGYKPTSKAVSHGPRMVVNSTNLPGHGGSHTFFGKARIYQVTLPLLVYMLGILLFLLPQAAACSQEGEPIIIVRSPVNTLGYVGDQVTFKCVVTFPFRVVWNLNDQSPPSDPVPPYNALIQESGYYNADPQSNLSSTLMVDASTDTNNTVVVCKAINIATLKCLNSPSVMLSVQGVPSAPMVIYNNDSQGVNLTIVEPYSLPGAEITGYWLVAHVSPQNITITANFTKSTFKFLFSEYNISRCTCQHQDQYVDLSLCASNAAGKGDFKNISVFLPVNCYSQYNSCNTAAISTSNILTIFIATLAVCFSFIATGIIMLSCIACLAKKKRYKISPGAEPMKTVENSAYGIAQTDNQAVLVKNGAYNVPERVFNELQIHVYARVDDPVYEKVGEGNEEYDHEPYSNHQDA